MKSLSKLILCVLGAILVIWLICSRDLIFQTPPEYWQTQKERKQ